MGAALARSFDGGERRRLAGLAGGVGLLHLAGWGLLLTYGLGHPAFLGLGGLAYTFGLRHAFDADHISAIDNTTLKLLQGVVGGNGELRNVGGVVGTLVSGGFLVLIGILNLFILIDIVRVYRRMR